MKVSACPCVTADQFQLREKPMTRMMQSLLSRPHLFGAAESWARPALKNYPQKWRKPIELCSLDFAAECDSSTGRRLRAGLITLEPRGAIGVHDHQDRPTIIHVLEGRVLSYWAGKPDRILSVGDCAAEGKDVTHNWIENLGCKPRPGTCPLTSRNRYRTSNAPSEGRP
jgi:quercetin dioxygenase-like cupin family protein